MDGEKTSLEGLARRSGGRLRLRLRAEAIAVQGHQRVVLCDLSERGAKIFAKQPIAVGRDMVLNWNKRKAFGRVQWERGGFHGLHFDEPIPNELLMEARSQQDAQGLTGEELEQWLAETGWAFGKSLI